MDRDTMSTLRFGAISDSGTLTLSAENVMLDVSGAAPVTVGRSDHSVETRREVDIYISCSGGRTGRLANEDIMAPLVAGQYGMDADNEKRARNREEEAAAGRQGNLIGSIFIGTFLFIAGVVTLGSRPAQITLTSASLAVRAAGYGAEIARSRIDSVRLTMQLNGLGSKLNGFQFGHAYAGLFAMRPFGKARLFVNVSRPPYVMIFSRDGVIMVNGDSPTATQRLFADLGGARTTAVTP